MVVRLALCVALLVFGARDLAAQPVDLGTLGGTYSAAAAVNTSGVVVGVSRLADNTTYRAFRWQSGALTALDPLPGGTHSGAAGINSAGEIVGWADREFAVDGATRAVIWYPGQAPRDLGELPGAQSCRANAINSVRVIVGACELNTFQTQAFVWKYGVMRPLPMLAGAAHMEAFSVNTYGDIVGRGTRPDGVSRAVLWTAGRVIDLGVPSGTTSSAAYAITRYGLIAGFADTKAWRKFKGSTYFRLLGTLPGQAWSQAFGATDLGQIVGWSGHRAFLWYGGVMSELPRLYGGTWAVAVAATGHYAAGRGSNVAGHTRAMLWYLP